MSAIGHFDELNASLHRTMRLLRRDVQFPLMPTTRLREYGGCNMRSAESIEARKWAQFPALGSILQDKRVPEHYYGMTSVSDNVFDQVDRLLQVLVIVRENSPLIAAAVKAEAKQQRDNRTDRPPPLLQDLWNLEKALGWVRSMFDDAIRELHSLR